MSIPTPAPIATVATPKVRVFRETLQWVIGFAVAAPTAVLLALGDDAASSTILLRVTAIAGAVKYVASVTMNLLDARGGTDTPLLGERVAIDTAGRPVL